MRSVYQQAHSAHAGGAVGWDQSNPTMKTNVGSYDGVVRFLGGMFLLHMGIHEINGWALAGALLIASSAASWCPLYALFHFSTTAADDSPPSKPSTYVK